MASLSLPRVLQQRKTSLEIERENFEKCQATSISKAINQLEVPVKEKHVRQAIIGTFHEKGAHTFWTIVLRLPLQENRIVAWKFCHVLHKVLREGHALCLPHSQRYQGKIDSLGKLWVHLREGYGKLIHLYCGLLITKLDFHKRNPRFPGNLAVTSEELQAIGENDINNYFQMSVEMFDYMDDVLALQSAIFGSLDMSRSNSMQSSGQCRLAPLIPCIQDAAQLYDFSVKILFKLHSTLPPDILDGHRNRFLKQFRDLKQFYQNSRTLQYFRNLITIPTLPENPPNFLIQSELRTYVTPVVILPPEEPDTDSVAEGSLIDTSDMVSDVPDSVSRNGSISPAGSTHLTDIIAERDHLIEHLQQEIGRLRKEIQQVIIEHRNQMSIVQEKITALETELATRESELVQERQLKEDLFQQASAVAQTQDSEQKNKEEKFNKLKDVYTKLREEHIQLIRQKAEVDKQVNKINYLKTNLEAKNTELETKIAELSHEKSKEVENIKQTSTIQSQKLEVLKTQYEYLKSENLNLAEKIESSLKEKQETEHKVRELCAQKENLDVRLKDSDSKTLELEKTLHEEKKQSSNQLNSIINGTIVESEEIIKHAVNEVDNPALSAATCGPDYFRSLVPDASSALNNLLLATETKEPESLVRAIILMAHRLSNLLLQGKATSNIATNIMFGEQMAEECKKLGESVIVVLKKLHEREEITSSMDDVRVHLNMVVELVDTVSGQLKGDSAEILADLVDNELAEMDKAIEEAAKRIEDMLNKSRAADSGIKLEVNEKILDSCTTLMHAIKILVKKSRLLQAEIVAQGKGSASVKEFYKRNHRWTEGLISAAKAVATGAKFLLTAADQVVKGEGKFEQLVVVAQDIAASTAQLVVASRVKAERNSTNLVALSEASRAVTSATGGVVATSKSCSQMVEDNEELDTSGISLHAAKRLEMEAQVKVLELEQSLQTERLKLASLRKRHYQLAGEQEGWDIIDKPE